jgi:5-formyltetrahydrofolate cyclo-ligase
METKQALRKIYKANRQTLDKREQHTLLAAMYDFMAEIPVSPTRLAMSYRAITQNKEVPTDIFEEYLSENWHATQFCYPKVEFGTHHMDAYIDDGLLVWEDAAFQLTQPASGTLADPTAIDVVLVPLLAFDEQGNRLGYGKGFYDYFLARCRPDTVKIGLSWFPPEKRLPEIDAFDIPLNYCVTPQQLYVF